MKKSPFKKIDCRLMEKLLLLPANALKVWLCHFNHEGAKPGSFPSLDRLSEKTNLNSKTVKAQRKWLIKNGWLKKTGERYGNGKFKVPVMAALEGTFPQGKVDGRVKNRVPGATAVQNLDHGNRGPKLSEQGTKTLPPVRDQKLDPKVEPLQVNQLGVAPAPKFTATSVCVDGRDRANSNSVSVHSQGTTVPEFVAAPDGNSRDSTEIPNKPEMTPRQVMELMLENLRKLLNQREHCTTEGWRDDLDQQILAAEWAVQQQQARLEKEGAVA